MANPNSDTDSSSMFMQRGDGRKLKSPTRAESCRKNSLGKPRLPAEVITVKDFFDFMKTAYQVYEHLEGDDDEGSKINWEELTKLTVINHVIEQQERDLLYRSAFTEQKTITSKSETALERKNSEVERVEKPYSCSEIEVAGRRRSPPPAARVELLGAWAAAGLDRKLNDVIDEGILDSILPYLVGYKKPSKTTSVCTAIIKKSPTNLSTDVKKLASFGGFVNERESRDRLGRRKSSAVAARERADRQQDGDVEIHVCDEVKGLKKDFRCPQKLLVSKMGYFAEVTAGQRLQDVDISVHCDIQIFEWLMRWVKRDSILVADWPLLEPHNAVPILVSASFLQMEPLLQDCLLYCHAHMNDIVETATNLACLSDALLTRLAATYTNAELEALRDRKDKIRSRLYCKMILSLAEPVPETLRGHRASLATLFRCARCGQLLGRHVAERVPCRPASMRVDRRGRVVSAHAREPAWSLTEHVSRLYGELRSWRRVYWRLWADCHFLRCQLCESYYPASQMEWCSYHAQGPPVAGRHACCGERAFRFETVARNSGCQFREHAPDERAAADAAVAELAARFRDAVGVRPPQLAPHRAPPERLARPLPREPGEEAGRRLQCEEAFWWEGIRLAPPRPPLGLLGKLYTGDTKFDPHARPGSPAGPALARASPERRARPARPADGELDVESVGPCAERGAGCERAGAASGAASDSDRSCDSAASDEDAPPRRRGRARAPPPPARAPRGRAAGRLWLPAQSARSNQDGQRRYEERATHHMRAALTRRQLAPRDRPQPPGGAFVRLEAEWRERRGAAAAGAARRGAAGSRRAAAPRPK